MKGYFINYGTSAFADRTGVGLKIRNQIKTFNKAELNCKEYVLSISKSKFLSVLYRLPFTNVYPIWKYDDILSSVDYIYFRRPFVMSGYMRNVLSKVKKNNPDIKIIIELPTYPYDAEYDTYKFKRMLIAKDSYNRVRLKGIVDRFANLSYECEIFGIPTIKFKNGIDVDDIQIRIPEDEPNNTIHLCAVAMFKEWHGYERIIKGLKTYYNNGGTRKLIFHFAGEGSALPGYKELVNDLSLNEHFVFHGFCDYGELNQIYNISSVALGSFGMYKKNLCLSCNLKSREAMARGIPFVTGCPTDIFIDNKDFKYYLEFPNDTSEIDINKIISFHDQIYQQPAKKVVAEIREFAYKNVNIGSCMKPIIDYIKS